MSCENFWTQDFKLKHILSFKVATESAEFLADYLTQKLNSKEFMNCLAPAFSRYFWATISSGQMAPQLIALGDADVLLFLGANEVDELDRLQSTLMAPFANELELINQSTCEGAAAVMHLNEEQMDFVGSTYVVQSSYSEKIEALRDTQQTHNFYFVDDVYGLEDTLEQSNLSLEACYLMPGEKLMNDLNERVRDKETIHIDSGAKMRC